MKVIFFISLFSFGLFYIFGKNLIFSDAIAQALGAMALPYLLFLISRFFSKDKIVPYIVGTIVVLALFFSQIYIKNQLNKEIVQENSPQIESSTYLTINKTEENEFQEETTFKQHFSDVDNKKNEELPDFLENILKKIHSNSRFEVVELDPIFTDKEIDSIIDLHLEQYQNEPIHPNEMIAFARITKACRLNSGTTIDIKNCNNIYYDLIDKSLNHNYQLVMKLITKKEREKLRNFQRKWIKDRAIYSAQYASRNYGGTLSSIDVGSAYQKWTFDRSEQLFELYSIIEYSKSLGETYPVVFE